MKIKNLVITAVLVTAFLCAGGYAVANDSASIAEQIARLQAQIQSLLQQIFQLRAQQQDGTIWCHNFNANIGIGIKTGNSEIEALKIALRKEGLYESSASTTNGYDEALASAVTGFQEKYASEILTPNGLKHGTGFVGVSTRKKFNDIYGCGVVQKPECSQNSDCPQRSCAQELTSPPCPQLKCVNGKCVSAPTACAGNGQKVYISSTFGPTECCSKNAGIKPSSNLYGETCVVTPDGSKGICTENWWKTCGDGVCQEVACSSEGCPSTENKCNCPKDCPNSTKPSITVTSPNGGEIWKKGTPQNINWTGGGLSTNISNYHGANNLDIELTKNNGLYRGLNNYCSVLSINSNGGSVSCSLPGDILESNDYKIAIIDNASKVSDTSDNYFSIVAAPYSGD